MMAEPDKVLAEEYKNKGNDLFKRKKYFDAIDWYSKAIIADPSSPILLCNRAFAYLKAEGYGAALNDATAAIQLDKNCVKAYYRRASAFMALNKIKESRHDFETVCKVCPKDKDAQEKFKECDKIYQRLRFENAIRVDEPALAPLDKRLRENINAIHVEDSYTGPRLEKEISVEFMTHLVETFKNQQKLHRKYALEILCRMYTLLVSLPVLPDVPVPPSTKFTICGDVHGQFYDLLNIFSINGVPSESNPYLFNGDFVDRGSFSVEVIFTMFGYHLLYPGHFHMSRGNHETINMNKMYGFEGEVKAKYNMAMCQYFTEVYNWLPLGHIIGKKIMVVHGGLFSKDGVTLEDIRKIDRNQQPPDSGLMTDMLWSDPQPYSGRTPSKRGIACSFGPDVTARFLSENGLDLLIRSHEMKDEGYEIAHGGKCITIFSAPNYCDEMNNKGAFITLHDDLQPKFTQFTHVPHPAMKAMAYSSGFQNFLG